ncbi:mutator type transposase [Tanacetum coccineum]
MKAFRSKRIVSDKMTGSFKGHYLMLREYAQELINQNPGTTIRIDVHQEPNLESPTRTFRRVYVCLGALKQGRAKCDLLLNNICEVFNRQLVDSKDQPIITCLEYIREYLMKRIVVVQKVIAKTVGPLTPTITVCVVNMDRRMRSCRKWELTGIICKHAVAAINNMFENGMGVVIQSRTVILPPFHEIQVSKPPKKREKGQGGASQADGSSQQSVAPSQAAGVKNSSIQVVVMVNLVQHQAKQVKDQAKLLVVNLV